jgi:hypothetical protein
MMPVNPDLQFIPSRYGGGTIFPRPFYLINHCLQAPDKAGMAYSLATGWFQNPDNKTSVHHIADQGDAIATRDLNLASWGCGNGNQHGYQTEHVGYADWTADEWRTPTMLQCMRLSAKAQAWVWWTEGMKMRGLDYYPEWLSLEEIASGSKSGLVTHNDMRIVFGGTTHTDPGQYFFYVELRDAIHAELDILTGNTPDPTPVPEPDPTPPPEEDDMAFSVITNQGHRYLLTGSALLYLDGNTYKAYLKVGYVKEQVAVTDAEYALIRDGIPKVGELSIYTPVAFTDYTLDPSGKTKRTGNLSTWFPTIGAWVSSLVSRK